MRLAWFIARRYLRSNRRSRFLSFITNFSVLGVMLGTAALIITLSVLDGFEQEIKSKVVEFTSHIQITGFQQQALSGVGTTVATLASMKNVRSVSPYAAKEGMIRKGDAVDGVFLKGIGENFGTSAAGIHMVEGEFRSDLAHHGLVIGRKLALKLNAGVGDRAVIFVLPEDGTGRAKAMQFTVTGIYESGMAEFDDVYAYTDIGSARQLCGLGDAVTGYDVMVSDVGAIDETAERIASALEYPHYVRTVFQLYRNLFSWVELQKRLSPVLLGLIILVATVNMIGTLLMFVLEKTRAIGVLKTLGAGPAMLRRVFLILGLAISSTGILLGNLLAFGLCSIQARFHLLTLPSEIYYMNTVPILLRPENFIVVTGIAFFLCLATTLLPAKAAASLDPVRALRFG